MIMENDIERIREAWAREQELEEEIRNCRHCKSARTRRHNYLHNLQMRYGEQISAISWGARLSRADNLTCRNHRLALRRFGSL